MKPTKQIGRGIEANRKYTGRGCEPIPVFEQGDLFLTCWRLSLLERLSALVFGRVWLCSKGRQVPVWLTTINENRVWNAKER